MTEFFLQYSQNSEKNIFLKIIWMHWTLAKIHPFIDGNGRMARLLLDFELTQNKNFPVIIPLIKRQEYISSFSSFSNHIELMLDIIYENGKDYLRMIKNYKTKT